MSDKPLKTVDNILAILAWKGKYTDSGQEVVDAGEVSQAKADLYQLMLSLVGDMEYRETLDMGLSSWTGEDYKAFGRNELRSELRKKLSEHFNGEGES